MGVSGDLRENSDGVNLPSGLSFSVPIARMMDGINAQILNGR